MTESLALLLPSIGWFVLGHAAARARFASDTDGQFLLRLLFFIALPALIVTKVSEAELSVEKLLLPLGNAIISAFCLGLAWLVAERRQLPKEQRGAMVLGAMILNNSFVLPFALAAFDDQAVTDLVLFDVGNALMVSLVAYPLAYRIGGREASLKSAVRRAVSAPLTIAVALGVGLNLGGITLPSVALGFLEPLGDLVGPLVLFALGVLFKPSAYRFEQAAITVAIRMLGGLAVGLVVVFALGVTGDSRTVILLAAGSPIGFMSVALASMTGLDRDGAARAISASLLIGIIMVPIALLFVA